MNWFFDLFTQTSGALYVAHAVLILSLVIAVGVGIGKLKVFGISIGIAGVLFAGIVAGHFGLAISPDLSNFVRDFGLILFVYTIGLQVGPSFFSSLKKEGLSLNLLAVAIVGIGVATALLIHFVTGTPTPIMVGIMSGAVTNTPGLGAATQAAKDIAVANHTKPMELGSAYAVAYPFGVLGIILLMIIVKYVFRVNIKDELSKQKKHQLESNPIPVKVSLKVNNPQLFARPLKSINEVLNQNIVISRIMHNDEISVPSPDTVLNEGDVVLVVSEKQNIDKLLLLIGEKSDKNLFEEPSDLITRRILVTKEVGKSIETLDIRNRYQVNLTRVYRAGLQFLASPSIALQFGDEVTAVGEETSIQEVVKLLGNSKKRLDSPNVIPLFLGIVLGVLLGSIPIGIPGMPVPLKLGLAGGPLVVAILMSRYGHYFSLSSFVTQSANLMLRELGIVLFLSCVGLGAGRTFVSTLMQGQGFTWMGYGALITAVPLILVTLFARIVLKKNFTEICGLVSGSMTDPPALAFANQICTSDAPSVAYATVYPLTTFLRIVAAQVLILLFL